MISTAVIWTRQFGPDHPVKMADIVATIDDGGNGQFIWTYSPLFLDMANEVPGSVGVRIFDDLRQARRADFTSIIAPHRDLIPAHTMLVPPKQSAGDTSQAVLRRAMRAGLPDHVRAMPDAFESFELLKYYGHGSLGVNDVFPGDEMAEAFYRQKPQPILISKDLLSRRDLWRSFIESDQLFEIRADRIREIMGDDNKSPSPGLGGMMPKISGVLSSDLSNDTTRFVPVVLKFEPVGYEGLADLEHAALEAHRAGGMEVPRSWVFKIAGERSAIAVERFDEDTNGKPLHQESMFSLYDSYSGGTIGRHQTDAVYQNIPSYLRIGNMVFDTRLTIAPHFKDSKKARENYFTRIGASIAVGNGDLHMENFAVVGGRSNLSMSKVFDVAPMRFIGMRNMIAPMKFKDDTPRLDVGTVPADLGELYQSTGRALGITPSRLKKCIDNVILIRDDFDHRLEALANAGSVAAVKLMYAKEATSSRIVPI